VPNIRIAGRIALYVNVGNRQMRSQHITPFWNSTFLGAVAAVTWLFVIGVGISPHGVTPIGRVIMLAETIGAMMFGVTALIVASQDLRVMKWVQRATTVLLLAGVVVAMLLFATVCLTPLMQAVSGIIVAAWVMIGINRGRREQENLRQQPERD
jgi:peptidoglycan/LPS O-acetylase OafA/YrhL